MKKALENRYGEIAFKMVNELPLLKTMIRDNNGKIPASKLHTRYGADGVACREILIGVLAYDMTMNKKNEV